MWTETGYKSLIFQEVAVIQFQSGFYALLHLTSFLFAEFPDAALAHNTAQFNEVSGLVISSKQFVDLLNLKSSSTISCLGFMLYFTLVLFAEFLDAALAHNTAQFNKVSVLSIQFLDFLNLKSCYTISYLGFILFFTSLWFYLLNLWMLHLHTIQLNSIKSLLSAQCIVLFIFHACVSSI
jgi:hypothetical protein